MVEPKNHQAEGCVEPLGHFAIVSCFVVKFSASGGVCTIVNGGGNSSNREGASAENVLIFNVIILVANDGINAAGDNARGGAGSGQPAFSGETGNVGGGKWFRSRSSGLGHGGVGE
jgi:hypothetical protein